MQVLRPLLSGAIHGSRVGPPACTPPAVCVWRRLSRRASSETAAEIPELALAAKRLAEAGSELAAGVRAMEADQLDVAEGRLAAARGRLGPALASAPRHGWLLANAEGLLALRAGRYGEASRGRICH